MINKEIKQTLIIGVILTLISSLICLKLNLYCSIICAVLGAVLTALFLYYNKKRYDTLNRLNDYLNQVCAGNYSLNVSENAEGEISILKNNLYKVITILKSQKEQLETDKEYLADSLADISHQLKTPLTSMLVMTDLLKEEKDEKRKTEFLSVIESQLDKMKWLITSLLKISKIDAGATELKSEDVSVKQLIDESIKPFILTLELKEISFVNNADDFCYKGDMSWSVEAVQNIIKNCIEHTDKNGILTISTQRTNTYNSLIISDNGCGIEKEDLPHIFERFYHGKNSSAESVGIGLALAKTVFERQRASIQATSEIGKGTSFEIRFYRSIV